MATTKVRRSTAYKRPGLNKGDILHGAHGNYVILKARAEGAGANGIVYRAREKGSGQIVAVKLFSPRERLEAKDQREYLTRFKNEFKKTQGLTHWNIVRAIDWGSHRVGYHPLPFHVLEYLRTTLENALEVTPSFLSRLSYCAQLADVIAFINRCGYIHRDIKPANIAVDDEGAIKLLDLGIALVDRQAFAAFVRGVKLYEERTVATQPRFFFSPEQKELARDFDPKRGFQKYRTPEARRTLLQKSDAFQVGRVCHEVLVGTNPVGQVEWQEHEYESIARFLRDVLKALLREKAESRLSLESASEVFHTTFHAHFCKTFRKARKLPRRLCECLRTHFDLTDEFSIKGVRHVEEAGGIKIGSVSYIEPSAGPRDLVEHGLAKMFERDQHRIYRLTPLGCDIRNIILEKDVWLNLVALHSKLQRIPHPHGVQQHSYKLRLPWAQWEKNPYGRHITEFARVKPSRKLRLYILPPREISNRWYVEVVLGNAGSPAWCGYEAEYLVVAGPSKQSVLASLRRGITQLDLGGVDGFTQRSKFYLSRNYFNLKPETVFSSLTSAGPTTIKCLVEPRLAGHDLKSGWEILLGWLEIEREKPMPFPATCVEKPCSAFVREVCELLEANLNGLPVEPDFSRESKIADKPTAANALSAALKELLTGTIIAAQAKEIPYLRRLVSLLTFFFSSCRISIRCHNEGLALHATPLVAYHPNVYQRAVHELIGLLKRRPSGEYPIF